MVAALAPQFVRERSFLSFHKDSFMISSLVLRSLCFFLNPPPSLKLPKSLAASPLASAKGRRRRVYAHDPLCAHAQQLR